MTEKEQFVTGDKFMLYDKWPDNIKSIFNLPSPTYGQRYTLVLFFLQNGYYPADLGEDLIRAFPRWDNSARTHILTTIEGAPGESTNPVLPIGVRKKPRLARAQVVVTNDKGITKSYWAPLDLPGWDQKLHYDVLKRHISVRKMF